MATRIEVVNLTVPAGTAIANPVGQLLFTGRAEIERIEVRVPPGPSGLVGFRFDHSNRQVIPKADGVWIITDDEPISWPLQSYSVQPDWRIKAYNLDVYDHTIEVRVLLIDVAPPAVSIVDLIPVE